MLAVVIVICIAAPIVLFPKENNYMAWARSALLILLTSSQARLAIEARRCQITTLMLLIVGTTVLPFVGLDVLTRIQSRESYEAAKREVGAFAHALEQANAIKLIAIPSRLYFLYKESMPNIGDAYYIAPVAKPSDVGGIVYCKSEKPTEAYLPGVVLFSHASIRYVPHLAGRRITRHEWSWSCDQYIAGLVHDEGI